jgi:glyoxylase-like metal-dependent hydrolase (beta-lactamase superfamily II)
VEDIDYVMCTHLHPDHVGWNTQLVDGRWVPTFPNANYFFSKKELGYWTERNAEAPIPHLVDSVLPVVEAGRVVEVASDHAFDDGIRLLPTPGHTPDHFAVHLQSAGEEAVMIGDMIHSPLQCRHTHLVARPDTDKDQARETRNAFMDSYCETDTLICTAHFRLPSIGRFVRFGDAFDFRFRE